MTPLNKEPDEDWIKKLEDERKAKDAFFKYNWQSPIPPHKRETFQGLKYYPIKKEYRLILPLHEHSKKDTIKIEDTGGNMRTFIRWGEFRFQINDHNGVLQAYKSSPDEDYLFVPFKDTTNGKTTYGAGRYLDLHEAHDKTEDGKWILDFNKAYNPYCAYSEFYVCPFTPIENWLNFPIEAGEKMLEEH